MISYRQITPSDLPELSRVSEIQLDEQRLKSDHAGWVAFNDGAVIGFLIANRSSGTLSNFTLMLSDHSKEVTASLFHQAEAWLFSHGWERIHLNADPKDSHVSSETLERTNWTAEQDRYSKPSPRETPINLEEHVLTCPTTGYSRILRLQPALHNDSPTLCLFLDGEHYWRDMDVVPLLNELRRAGTLPDTTLAFVGHLSGAARQKDYTCNQNYATFIGETVLPWLLQRFPNLDQNQCLIAGLSLSGLMATFLTFNYPEYFCRCLSQSGSYWWDLETFQKAAHAHAHVDSRFWLSVGDREVDKHIRHPPSGLLQEISQLEGVERAVRILEDTGATVRFHTYQGGHKLKPWRKELPQALSWLLNTR